MSNSGIIHNYVYYISDMFKLLESPLKYFALAFYRLVLHALKLSKGSAIIDNRSHWESISSQWNLCNVLKDTMITLIGENRIAIEILMLL